VVCKIDDLLLWSHSLPLLVSYPISPSIVRFSETIQNQIQTHEAEKDAVTPPVQGFVVFAVDVRRDDDA
jgi:hypothetical protein